MNTQQFEGQWEKLKGTVQKNWGKLTSDDLQVIKGNKKELVGKVMSRYGLALEDAEKQVGEFMEKEKCE